jgi:hypothetical protein
MRRWLMLAGMLLTAAVGHACSCGGPGPVCSIELGTSMIFRGTVVERTLIRPPAVAFKGSDGTTVYGVSGGKYRVRFSVQETFSGVPEQEAVVYTYEQNSMCGFNFEEGAEYAVFTYKNTEDGELWTSHCSRTAKLTAGVENESVMWMRARPKAAAGSEIFGSLLLPRGSAERTVPSKVSLDGPARRTVVPDGDGKYWLNGLPAGEYKVTASVPSGFSTQEPRTAKLGDKGCAEVDWHVSYEGQVRGRLLDVDGRPVADLSMSLERTVPDENGRRVEQQHVITDLEGRYVFRLVPPGEYVVKVEHPGALTDEGFSSLYYPHATTLEEAEVVKLGASATRDGLDFVLPRLRPTLPVQVKVVQLDGSVAPAGLMVFAFENNSRQAAPTRTAMTDREGWAALPLFSGREYSISVALDRNHPGCGSGLRMLVKDRTDVGVLTMTNPEACLRR